jgi:Fe-S oxidoreductase
MATYKAEFLSHYYQARLRPRYAYVSGLISWWSRLAASMPATANFFTQTPLLSSGMKFAAGYSQKREIPSFAPETFRHWFERRGPRNHGKPEVILWPDTFNNHFTPAVAKAAVEVLEHAGFRVQIPNRTLCCGRPLYDYGMLKTAKRMLRDIMTSLREPIRAGTPIVGLEPSCMTVFRDELTNLLPDDNDAKRLHNQSFILSEFLHDHVPNYEPPKLSGRAVVHGHCHHKSLLDFDSETDLLKRAGLDCTVLDSGCCGMAGSFGYEADHYEVGLACGERVLLPSVRSAPHESLIVTDGFSCREMIRQETDRRALHIAQVLQIALHEGPDRQQRSRPEKKYAEPEHTPAVPVALMAAGALLGGAIWWGGRRRREQHCRYS